VPSVICNFMIYTDFLTQFELDHTAVVDHELDGAVADRLERLPELLEQRRRQRELGAEFGGLGVGRVRALILFSPSTR
jgi:hypothetical protein